MAITLGDNSYGKARVRVAKVTRDGDRHTFREFSVDVVLRGDFFAAHADGDNAHVLPTDTMKNTVHAFAREATISSIEDFAALLAQHFVTTHEPTTGATVTVSERLWTRMVVHGKPHDHAFDGPGEERPMCEVDYDGAATRITSGIDGMVVLKTTHSGFEHFTRDKYTSLKDAADRIFATSVTARWTYTRTTDFADARSAIRTALATSFAEHDSKSVQHTLYAMGKAAIESCDAIDAIHLEMPNLHYLLIDLVSFGLENENEVFLPIDEPHGLICATVERSG